MPIFRKELLLDDWNWNSGSGSNNDYSFGSDFSGGDSYDFGNIDFGSTNYFDPTSFGSGGTGIDFNNIDLTSSTGSGFFGDFSFDLGTPAANDFSIPDLTTPSSGMFDTGSLFDPGADLGSNPFSLDPLEASGSTFVDPVTSFGGGDFNFDLSGGSGLDSSLGDLGSPSSTEAMEAAAALASQIDSSDTIGNAMPITPTGGSSFDDYLSGADGLDSSLGDLGSPSSTEAMEAAAALASQIDSSDTIGNAMPITPTGGSSFDDYLSGADGLDSSLGDLGSPSSTEAMEAAAALASQIDSSDTIGNAMPVTPTGGSSFDDYLLGADGLDSSLGDLGSPSSTEAMEAAAALASQIDTSDTIGNAMPNTPTGGSSFDDYLSGADGLDSSLGDLGSPSSTEAMEAAAALASQIDSSDTIGNAMPITPTGGSSFDDYFSGIGGVDGSHLQTPSDMKDGVIATPLAQGTGQPVQERLDAATPTGTPVTDAGEDYRSSGVGQSAGLQTQQRQQQLATSAETDAVDSYVRQATSGNMTTGQAQREIAALEDMSSGQRAQVVERLSTAADQAYDRVTSAVKAQSESYATVTSAHKNWESVVATSGANSSQAQAAAQQVADANKDYLASTDRRNNVEAAYNTTVAQRDFVATASQTIQAQALASVSDASVQARSQVVQQASADQGADIKGQQLASATAAAAVAGAGLLAPSSVNVGGAAAAPSATPISGSSETAAGDKTLTTSASNTTRPAATAAGANVSAAATGDAKAGGDMKATGDEKRADKGSADSKGGSSAQAARGPSAPDRKDNSATGGDAPAAAAAAAPALADLSALEIPSFGDQLQASASTSLREALSAQNTALSDLGQAEARLQDHIAAGGSAQDPMGRILGANVEDANARISTAYEQIDAARGQLDPAYAIGRVVENESRAAVDTVNDQLRGIPASQRTDENTEYQNLMGQRQSLVNAEINAINSVTDRIADIDASVAPAAGGLDSNEISNAAAVASRIDSSDTPGSNLDARGGSGASLSDIVTYGDFGEPMTATGSGAELSGHGGSDSSTGPADAAPKAAAGPGSEYSDANRPARMDGGPAGTGVATSEALPGGGTKVTYGNGQTLNFDATGRPAEGQSTQTSQPDGSVNVRYANGSEAIFDGKGNVVSGQVPQPNGNIVNVGAGGEQTVTTPKGDILDVVGGKVTGGVMANGNSLQIVNGAEIVKDINGDLVSYRSPDGQAMIQVTPDGGRLTQIGAERTLETKAGDVLKLDSNGQPYSGTFANGHTLADEDGAYVRRDENGKFVSSQSPDGSIRSAATPDGGTITTFNGQTSILTKEGHYLTVDPKTNMVSGGVLADGNHLTVENGVQVVRTPAGEIVSQGATGGTTTGKVVNPILAHMSDAEAEALLSRDIKKAAPSLASADQIDSDATKKAVSKSLIEFQGLSGEARDERVTDLRAHSAQLYQGAVAYQEQINLRNTEMKSEQAKLDSMLSSGASQTDIETQRANVAQLGQMVAVLENGQKLTLANYAVSSSLLATAVKIDGTLDAVAGAGSRSEAYAQAKEAGLLQFSHNGKQYSTLSEAEVLKATGKAEAAINARTDIDADSKKALINQVRTNATVDSYATHNVGKGASISASTVASLTEGIKTEVSATQERTVDRYTRLMGEDAKPMVGLMAATDRVAAGSSMQLNVGGQTMTATADATGNHVSITDGKGNLVTSFARDGSSVRVESAVAGTAERAVSVRTNGIWKNESTASDISVRADAQRRADLHNAQVDSYNESASSMATVEHGASTNLMQRVTAEDILAADQRMGRVKDAAIDVAKAVLTGSDIIVGGVNLVATGGAMAVKGWAGLADGFNDLIGVKSNLADMVVVDEFANRVNSAVRIGETKDILSSGYSQARQQENAAVQAATDAAIASGGRPLGWTGTASQFLNTQGLTGAADLMDKGGKFLSIAGTAGGAMLDNGFVASGAIIESAPYMLAGMGAGRLAATEALSAGRAMSNVGGVVANANLVGAGVAIAGTTFNELNRQGVSGVDAFGTAMAVGGTAMLIGKGSSMLGIQDEGARLATAGLVRGTSPITTALETLASVQSTFANQGLRAASGEVASLAVAGLMTGVRTAGGVGYQTFEEAVSESSEGLAKVLSLTGDITSKNMFEAAAAGGQGAVIGLVNDGASRSVTAGSSVVAGAFNNLAAGAPDLNSVFGTPSSGNGGWSLNPDGSFAPVGNQNYQNQNWSFGAQPIGPGNAINIDSQGEAGVKIPNAPPVGPAATGDGNPIFVNSQGVAGVAMPAQSITAPVNFDGSNYNLNSVSVGQTDMDGKPIGPAIPMDLGDGKNPVGTVVQNGFTSPYTSGSASLDGTQNPFTIDVPTVSFPSLAPNPSEFFANDQAPFSQTSDQILGQTYYAPTSEPQLYTPPAGLPNERASNIFAQPDAPSLGFNGVSDQAIDNMAPAAVGPGTIINIDGQGNQVNGIANTRSGVGPVNPGIENATSAYGANLDPVEAPSTTMNIGAAPKPTMSGLNEVANNPVRNIPTPPVVAYNGDGSFRFNNGDAQQVLAPGTSAIPTNLNLNSNDPITSAYGANLDPVEAPSTTMNIGAAPKPTLSGLNEVANPPGSNIPAPPVVAYNGDGSFSFNNGDAQQVLAPGTSAIPTNLNLNSNDPITSAYGANLDPVEAPSTTMIIGAAPQPTMTAMAAAPTTASTAVPQAQPVADLQGRVEPTLGTGPITLAEDPMNRIEPTMDPVSEQGPVAASEAPVLNVKLGSSATDIQAQGSEAVMAQPAAPAAAVQAPVMDMVSAPRFLAAVDAMPVSTIAPALTGGGQIVSSGAFQGSRFEAVPVNSSTYPAVIKLDDQTAITGTVTGVVRDNTGKSIGLQVQMDGAPDVSRIVDRASVVLFQSASAMDETLSARGISRVNAPVTADVASQAGSADANTGRAPADQSAVPNQAQAASSAPIANQAPNQSSDGNSQAQAIPTEAAIAGKLGPDGRYQPAAAIVETMKSLTESVKSDRARTAADANKNIILAPATNFTVAMKRDADRIAGEGQVEAAARLREQAVRFLSVQRQALLENARSNLASMNVNDQELAKANLHILQRAIEELQAPTPNEVKAQQTVSPELKENLQPQASQATENSKAQVAKSEVQEPAQPNGAQSQAHATNINSQQSVPDANINSSVGSQTGSNVGSIGADGRYQPTPNIVAEMQTLVANVRGEASLKAGGANQTAISGPVGTFKHAILRDASRFAAEGNVQAATALRAQAFQFLSGQRQAFVENVQANRASIGVSDTQHVKNGLIYLDRALAQLHFPTPNETLAGVQADPASNVKTDIDAQFANIVDTFGAESGYQLGPLTSSTMRALYDGARSDVSGKSGDQIRNSVYNPLTEFKQTIIVEANRFASEGNVEAATKLRAQAAQFVNSLLNDSVQNSGANRDLMLQAAAELQAPTTFEQASQQIVTAETARMEAPKTPTEFLTLLTGRVYQNPAVTSLVGVSKTIPVGLNAAISGVETLRLNADIGKVVSPSEVKIAVTRFINEVDRMASTLASKPQAAQNFRQQSIQDAMNLAQQHVTGPSLAETVNLGKRALVGGDILAATGPRPMVTGKRVHLGENHLGSNQVFTNNNDTHMAQIRDVLSGGTEFNETQVKQIFARLRSQVSSESVQSSQKLIDGILDKAREMGVPIRTFSELDPDIAKLLRTEGGSGGKSIPAAVIEYYIDSLPLYARANARQNIDAYFGSGARELGVLLVEESANASFVAPVLFHEWQHLVEGQSGPGAGNGRLIRVMMPDGLVVDPQNSNANSKDPIEVGAAPYADKSFRFDETARHNETVARFMAEARALLTGAPGPNAIAKAVELMSILPGQIYRTAGLANMQTSMAQSGLDFMAQFQGDLSSLMSDGNSVARVPVTITMANGHQSQRILSIPVVPGLLDSEIRTAIQGALMGARADGADLARITAEQTQYFRDLNGVVKGFQAHAHEIPNASEPVPLRIQLDKGPLDPSQFDPDRTNPQINLASANHPSQFSSDAFNDSNSNTDDDATNPVIQIRLPDAHETGDSTALPAGSTAISSQAINSRAIASLVNPSVQSDAVVNGTILMAAQPGQMNVADIRAREDAPSKPTFDADKTQTNFIVLPTAVASSRPGSDPDKTQPDRQMRRGTEITPEKIASLESAIDLMAGNPALLEDKDASLIVEVRMTLNAAAKLSAPEMKLRNRLNEVWDQMVQQYQAQQQSDPAMALAQAQERGIKAEPLRPDQNASEMSAELETAIDDGLFYLDEASKDDLYNREISRLIQDGHTRFSMPALSSTTAVQEVISFFASHGMSVTAQQVQGANRLSMLPTARIHEAPGSYRQALSVHNAIRGLDPETIQGLDRSSRVGRLVLHNLAHMNHNISPYVRNLIASELANANKPSRRGNSDDDGNNGAPPATGAGGKP